MSLLVSSRQKALGAYVVTLNGEINGQTYPVLENKLDQLLEETALHYQAEVEFELKRLGDAIEPIMITVIGALVAVLDLLLFV